MRSGHVNTEDGRVPFTLDRLRLKVYDGPMKKLSPFWIFFALSMVSLVGLVASYTLRLPMIVQGSFLAGLILMVLLGKVRMGLSSVGEEVGTRRGRWDLYEDPRSISIGNPRRHSDTTLDPTRHNHNQG
jgi:hypothetical protein